MKLNKGQSTLRPKLANLGERLRQSITNFTTDVWGLEEKAASSLSQCFKKVSTARNLSDGEFTIRINNQNPIQIVLFHNNAIHALLTIGELLQLLNAPFLKDTEVQNKLKRLFDKYAEKHRSVNLSLKIRVEGQKIRCYLVEVERVLETIPFPEVVSQLS